MLRRDAQSDRPILVAEPLDERMKRQHRHLSAIEKVASMLRRRLGSREGCEHGGVLIRPPWNGWETWQNSAHGNRDLSRRHVSNYILGTPGLVFESCNPPKGLAADGREAGETKCKNENRVRRRWPG